MGFFSSRGRGEGGSSEPARESASTTAATGSKPAQSWSTLPTAQSAAEERSRENDTTTGRSAGAKGGDQSMAAIGKSIVFKGELSGEEDLEIEGQVEGNIRLSNNQLTIGPNGRVTATVLAKSIIVIGRVKGNLTATERIEIHAAGIVEGDVKAPRLNVQEGAVLNGGIDMSASASAADKASTQPAAAAGTAPAAAAREEARKPAPGFSQPAARA